MQFMRLFCFLLFLGVCTSIYSQSSRVSKFSVSPIGSSSALIEWTMNAGSTCLSLSVQRSNNQVDFKTVYTYPGVCGSDDVEVDYSWIDSEAIPFAKNYYRIKLEEAEFTLIELLDLDSDLAEKDMVLFPNPAEEYVQVKIKNPSQQKFSLTIYASNGDVVLEQKENNGNRTQLNLSRLNAGVYTIQVVLENGRKIVSPVSIL